MIVNHTVSNPAAADNPALVTVRREDIEQLRDSLGHLSDQLQAIADLLPMDLFGVMGKVRAHADILACTARPPALALYDPPAPEPEPFVPSSEDAAWAAESLAPCVPPRNADDIVRWLADTLESVRLEPTVNGDSVDFLCAGTEWRVQLQDMTAYYRHMEAMAREHDECHRLPAGDLILLDNGMAVG